MDKRAFWIMVLLFAGAAAGFGCEMSFSLLGGSGSAVVPGRTVDLVQGKQYTLHVLFHEDHGRCLLDPEDTEFLLGGKAWPPASSVKWKTSGRDHTADIVFTAAKTGMFQVEVIRDCAKGGYDDFLAFRVS
jgi:hypothetical protein